MDRLQKKAFKMKFCIDCHKLKKSPTGLLAGLSPLEKGVRYKDREGINIGRHPGENRGPGVL